MKLLLFALIFIYNAIPFSSSTDELRWSPEKQLTYSDFQGPVPSASPWAANTNSSIYFSYDFTDTKLRDVIVYSSFSPSKSWMRKKIPEVLHHEQLHFDITELFARKLYLEGSELIGSSHVENQLKQLFRDANDDCNVMQNQYDEETEHGVNTEKQEAWEKKIHDLLSETAPYPTDQK